MIKLSLVKNNQSGNINNIQYASFTNLIIYKLSHRCNAKLLFVSMINLINAFITGLLWILSKSRFLNTLVALLLLVFCFACCCALSCTQLHFGLGFGLDFALKFVHPPQSLVVYSCLIKIVSSFGKWTALRIPIDDGWSW